MFITFFIISRILLIACFVLIIGYIFGSFSRHKTLTLFTKIAAVLLVAGFIMVNIFMFRFRQGHSRFDGRCGAHRLADSSWHQPPGTP